MKDPKFENLRQGVGYPNFKWLFTINISIQLKLFSDLSLEQS